MVSNEEKFLTDTLQTEILAAMSQTSSEFVKCFSFSKVGRLELRFTITNLEMAFKLNYIIDQPLDFIFSSNIIEQYDTLFKYYLRFIIFQFIFSKIFSVFKNQKRNFHPVLVKAMKILNKSFCMMKCFQSFLFDAVIDKTWKKFRNSVENSLDILEIKESHNKFLNNLIKISYSEIFITVNKLHEKIGKFYLKTIAGESEYLDFDNLKDDKKFLDLIGKIEKLNVNFQNSIKNEELVGVFHDLKYYMN